MTLQLKSKRKMDRQAVLSEFTVSLKDQQGIKDRIEKCQRYILNYQRLRNQDLIIGDMKNAHKLTREIRSLQSKLIVMQAIVMVDFKVDDVEVVM